MSPNISRGTFDSLLPPGAAWSVEQDGDLDKFLDGISDNSEEIREFLSSLAFIRDCQNTPILSDLEKEYGLQPNSNLSLQERIDRLCAAKTSRSGFGADYMQDKLQQAGFDVQVHINNPPVDPDLFLFEAFKIYCNDGINAFCGNQNAVCGGVGGSLIVNGDFYTETQELSVVCASEFAVSGSDRALCGRIFNVKRELITYTIPGDIGYWGLFFFVGGDATRNVSGELTSIEPAEISVSRREEIIRLIVKYKPSHSWAGFIGTFV